MSNYKSQYGQDKWVIEEVFNGLQGGYFVDLAAGDGEFISNTYTLEKDYNWSGICVEPNQSSFTKLNEMRSCICDDNIIMQDNFEVEFIEYAKVTTYEHLLSAVAGTSTSNTEIDNIFKKTAISLNTLLNNHNAPDTIHYISLDIEGSEIYVLQDFLPNNTRKVLSWSIEVNPGERHERDILNWMKHYNYTLISKDGINGRLGHDYLFLHNEII